MKRLFKVSIFALLLFSLIKTSLIVPIKAEAGLSEIGRTEYFKLSEKYAIVVLPGPNDIGGDSIDIVTYEPNPLRNRIDGFLCASPYKSLEAIGDGFGGQYPVYLQGDVIYDASGILELSTGTYTSATNYVSILIYPPVPSPYQRLVKDLNLKFVPEQRFDINYIRSHYERLDMSDLDDFNCGLVNSLAIIVLICCCCMLSLVLVVIIIIKKYRKRKSLKITNNS